MTELVDRAFDALLKDGSLEPAKAKALGEELENLKGKALVEGVLSLVELAWFLKNKAQAGTAAESLTGLVVQHQVRIEALIKDGELPASFADVQQVVGTEGAAAFENRTAPVAGQVKANALARFNLPEPD